MSEARRLQIAPSILTADFTRLGEDVSAVAPLVDWFHLDVMDGHYVENITFGPDLVAAVRSSCDLPLHVHLMITEPLRFADRFMAAGARRISFHPEVVDDVGGAIRSVRDLGGEVGLAIHPDVPLASVERYVSNVDVILVMTVRPGFGGQSYLWEVVPKIAEARRMVESQGLTTDIEVDGGVNLETVASAVEAGAGILVAGSAIFDGVDPVGAARRLRERLNSLGGTT